MLEIYFWRQDRGINIKFKMDISIELRSCVKMDISIELRSCVKVLDFPSLRVTLDSVNVKQH